MVNWLSCIKDRQQLACVQYKHEKVKLIACDVISDCGKNDNIKQSKYNEVTKQHTCNACKINRGNIAHYRPSTSEFPNNNCQKGK